MQHSHFNRHQAPGARFDEELIAMLQYVFIAQRRHDIAKISQRLNMTYQELHAFISGRRTMPATLLARITEITRDKIFLDTVFGETSIRWRFAPESETKTDDPVRESLDVFHSVGRIAEALREALKDGEISDQERAEIRMRVDAAAKELEQLKTSLTIRPILARGA